MLGSFNPHFKYILYKTQAVLQLFNYFPSLSIGYFKYKDKNKWFHDDLQPYSKSKLELEANLGEILPVNCKFICCSTST